MISSWLLINISSIKSKVGKGCYWSNLSFWRSNLIFTGIWRFLAAVNLPHLWIFKHHPQGQQSCYAPPEAHLSQLITKLCTA